MKEIFNIFPRAKPKISERPKVIADYRERNSLVISELVSMGFEVEFNNLEIGDYIIKGLIIERKTVSDFISSMLNKRLLQQLENLEKLEKKLLIIEGIDEQDLYSDSQENIGLNSNSVRGFLLSILLKYKIPIIFAKNYEDTSRFLYLIAKKEEREISLKFKKKARTKKEQLQYILEGFPGIGPKTARKLLKKFKTIKDFINATEDELRDILGKKTTHILRIIEQKF